MPIEGFDFTEKGGKMVPKATEIFTEQSFYSSHISCLEMKK